MAERRSGAGAATPRAGSLEVLDSTVDGVRNAVEPFGDLAKLIHLKQLWPDFASTTDDLSDWVLYVD